MVVIMQPIGQCISLCSCFTFLITTLLFYERCQCLYIFSHDLCCSAFTNARHSSGVCCLMLVVVAAFTDEVYTNIVQDTSLLARVCRCPFVINLDFLGLESVDDPEWKQCNIVTYGYLIYHCGLRVHQCITGPNFHTCRWTIWKSILLQAQALIHKLFCCVCWDGLFSTIRACAYCKIVLLPSWF